jgi:hypothetical protein
VLSAAELLPAGLVDAAYAAMARGLHLAAAAVAVLMLATALAMAAVLRRAQARDEHGRQAADVVDVPRPTGVRTFSSPSRAVVGVADES